MGGLDGLGLKAAFMIPRFVWVPELGEHRRLKGHDLADKEAQILPTLPTLPNQTMQMAIHKEVARLWLGMAMGWTTSGGNQCSGQNGAKHCDRRKGSGARDPLGPGAKQFGRAYHLPKHWVPEHGMNTA